MNVPNQLTVIRLMLTVLMVIFYTIFPDLLFTPFVILGFFALGSLTDFLDGFIARRKNLVTNFGKLMDPVADKILVLSAIMILIQIGTVPYWTMLIVLFREILVLGIRMLALEIDKSNVIAADIFGKIKTLTQMVSIIMIFTLIGLNNYYASDVINVLDIIAHVLFYVSVGFTVLSGAEIVYKNRKNLKDF